MHSSERYNIACDIATYFILHYKDCINWYVRKNYIAQVYYMCRRYFYHPAKKDKMVIFDSEYMENIDEHSGEEFIDSD